MNRPRTGALAMTTAERSRRWRERKRMEAAGEQFERDVRGDHDSPLSYAWVPPADTTPSAAEVASWEA